MVIFAVSLALVGPMNSHIAPLYAQNQTQNF